MADLEKKVEDLMFEWMTKTAEEFEAAIKVSMDEEQDLLIVLFGPPGKGKSNLGFLYSLFANRIVNQHMGLKRKFSLKNQTAWLGADYMKLFKEPAAGLAQLLSNGDKDLLQELKAKSKGMVYWLDEAKDLNVLEMMNTFNRTFSGILATCRALQHIYILCIDTPTKLISDIREFRINFGEYVFISKRKHNFDGVSKNVRMGGMYGRKEWSRMIFNDSKTIRSALLQPGYFINKFKPYILEPIPLFPKCKMQDDYTMLKYGSMGQIILNDLTKWEEKMKEKDAKAALSGIPCKCGNCGYTWMYRGGKITQSSAVGCPGCSYKYQLKRLLGNYLPW